MQLTIYFAVTDFERLEKASRDGPTEQTALAKWRILNRLHDRNETLYYKVEKMLRLYASQ